LRLVQRVLVALLVAEFDELDEIITDEGAPQEELERIRSAGVKLTVVGK
jgi:DeoR/GlpR family transcriptional regulator of sugar metabolism